VPTAGLFAWQSKRIQDALPDTSLEDREFLLSGISPAGWDKMFPEEETDACVGCGRDFCVGDGRPCLPRDDS
jgi:hypothetical protein